MGLTLQPEKCVFVAREVPYLGHVIDGQFVRADVEKLLAIRDFPVPNSVRLLRCFLGMINWLHRFLPGIVPIVAPL